MIYEDTIRENARKPFSEDDQRDLDQALACVRSGGTTGADWRIVAEILGAEVIRRQYLDLDAELPQIQYAVKGETEMPANYRSVIDALCSLYAARGEVNSSSNVNQAKKALREFLGLD